MSHTTEINTTQIIQVGYVANYLNDVSNANNSLGFGPIQPGESVPTATQKLAINLKKAFQDKWTIAFKDVDLSDDIDMGYMGPLANMIPDSAPPCAVQQIKEVFENWGLPTTTSVPTRIAKAITLEVSAQGGMTGFSHGRFQVTAAETILWLAGYATLNITQSETGILYVFGAALEPMVVNLLQI